jgi:O-antigen/teichoic acid export membrane protein
MTGGTDPEGPEPYVTKPAITDPGVTDPGVTGPGVTGPGVTELGVTELGVTDHGVTGPGLRDPDESEVGGTESGVGSPEGDQSVALEGALAGGQRSVARTLIGGGLWNNLVTCIPLIVNIALTPYLIHGFGIDRWGLYLLVNSVSNFLGPFGGGASPVITRYFGMYAAQGNRRKNSEVFFTLGIFMLLVGLLLTVFCWGVSSELVQLFHVSRPLRGQGEFLFRTLGVITAAQLFQQLFIGIVNAHQRYAWTSLATVISYLAWPVGMVVCVTHHYGLRGVAVVLLIQQVLTTLAVLPNAVRYLDWASLRLLPRKEIREIAHFGLTSSSLSVTGLINSEVDTLLIGAVFSLNNVTQFNTGNKFAYQLRNLTFTALGPAGVHLARAYGLGGDELAAKEFVRLQRLWVVATTGWCAVGLGAIYFGIVAWLGSGFEQSGEVGVIAMAAITVNLWTGVLTQYVNSVGRPDLELRYSVLGVCINLLFTIPLAFVGPLGVVGATTIGSIVASLYLMLIVDRRYEKKLRRFWLDVPLFEGGVALGVTVGLELLIRPSVPGGAGGLLVTGVPALIGLAVFCLFIFRGIRREIWVMICSRKVNLGALVGAVMAR